MFVYSTHKATQDTNDLTTQRFPLYLPWLRFHYPDRGLPTLTEIFLRWLRFFYTDWGFSTLIEGFLTWLKFSYLYWGFSIPKEVFSCFFLSCKANTSVKHAKMGHGPHPSKIFVFFYVLFVSCRSVYCSCVNVYCTTATGWLPNCS